MSIKELFDSPEPTSLKNMPLAARMRPRNLDEFQGQSHLLGRDGFLRKIIESDRIPSLILYGPPGCGKTALAMLIAYRTKNHFRHLNAVTSTVADVREVISIATGKAGKDGKRTILFLDEIAHFNKLQQDALMKDVEEGIIILVGATTHNPNYYVNTPLLSRATVFRFSPLTDAEIKNVLKNALHDRERGLGDLKISVEEEVLDSIASASGGDARRALNTIESAIVFVSRSGGGDIMLDNAAVKEVLQNSNVSYDKSEDEHYDTISAFIKSMRGSDPDAAIYWLAKMVVAGEDPRFIARRMLIFASEDVGNADPQALVIANACYQSVEVVGMPEARIILAQGVIYLSSAPKSNSAYKAIGSAESEIKKGRVMKVPEYLRQGGNDDSGKAGYLYPHDFPGHYVPQKYMPSRKRFYFPSDSGHERKIQFFLNHLKRLEKQYHEKQDKERNP